MNKEYTFFWSGVFSQWYPSKFVVSEKEFSCAEQFMMYCKAIHFNDYDTAELIMNTNNPKTQKQLGRQVENFDPNVWNDVAKDYVYVGNIAKFEQNPKLLQELRNTGDTKLVEASPYDKIWGIGLNEHDAKITPKDEWNGTNYLGIILTQVREDLKNFNP